MAYKVFLVEDELVTREGIRDNVNWNAAGFEFCGEAQDGEVALPLIERTQPDVLITDIKMPFMDGLQLSQIVRTQMPWVKIIVLSGHDEFEFAQTAIKLGVSEYLLKPISAAEFQTVLGNLAATLDQESEDRAKLKELQNQVKDMAALKRDKLLLQLAVGGISSSEAIEQYGRIGLRIIAQYYLVVLVKVDLFENGVQLDPAKHQEIQDIVTDLAGMYPGAHFAQRSAEELLLVMTGDDREQLRQDALFLATLIQKDIKERAGYRAKYGVGAVQQHLTNINLSFADALAIVNDRGQNSAADEDMLGPSVLTELKIDHATLEHYLRAGTVEEFDSFYRTNLKHISEAALHSTLIKHYLFVDVLLAAGQMVNDLGGREVEVIPAMASVQGYLVDLNTIDQIRDALETLFSDVLAFRNAQATNEKAELIYRARAYIDTRFMDPNLLLEDVAASISLSPSHFSMTFGRETGESFKSYLTRVRIERAKELLRTTNLKCSEIAYQSGYSDPQYFSYVFKKNTGVPPQQFRQLTQT